MRTLVVLPTYEEAPNIAQVLNRIRAAAPAVDILVVDDASPDGTAAMARAIGAELGRVDVLVRDRKAGLGNAYRHGFDVGLDRGYEVLMQMDADLSHDPTDIVRLLATVDAGADAAIGSRYIPGGSIPYWTWYRRALSTHGNRYVCALLELDIHDASSGFRAYTRDTLKAIEVTGTRANGYAFQIETAYRMTRADRRIDEIPIAFTDRVRGRSKMSIGIIAEEMGLVAWWGIRDRSRRWLRNARARRRRG
jgi:dolichol-phosphate mannosyltransferase